MPDRDAASAPCTSQWHEIRKVKRADRCPLCGESNYPLTPISVCAHEDFRADVDVTRVVSEQEATALVGFTVDVRAHCIACGEPVKFRCPTVGMTFDRPAVSVDGTELRCPAWLGDDPTLGTSLVGFSVQLRAGGDG